MRKDKHYTHSDCLKQDGSLIKFVHKNYLTKYLRYLKQRERHVGPNQSIY
jgi:hypothetical protein